MGKTISICNHKGGVLKTTTTVNMGIALAREGKKVLLVDSDPQGDLTFALGVKNAGALEWTLNELMHQAMDDEELSLEKAIIHHEEDVDLIPANLSLSTMDPILTVTPFGRERVMERVLSPVKALYDFILIDTHPSLSLTVINALTASEGVIIPVEPAPLAVKDLTEIIKTIAQVKKNLQASLNIDGILITRADSRTILSSTLEKKVRDAFGENMRVFETVIPQNVKLSETAGAGQSIFKYAPSSKGAKAYEALAKEVLTNG